MIMLQIINVSDSVLYDRSKAHADFLQIINACVSHEMRTPLNSINVINILKREIYNKIDVLSELKDDDLSPVRLLKTQMKGCLQELWKGINT